jgi:TRAP-type C4-dicarboxylate transport system substrate-binding protein
VCTLFAVLLAAAHLAVANEPSARAVAEQPPLRMATLVPNGTAWARELKAFAREVEETGHLKMKFYWGGIAGDEREMVGRIKRGQLDGAAGASVCTELAPSLKVTRLQGLFPNRDAHERLVRQIPGVDEEFRKQGFVNLGVAGLGPSVVFTRVPITSWEQLKRLRLWRWDLDDVGWRQDRMMGMTVVPMSVEAAAGAFDAGKIDGFVALAASALAFQWHSHAPIILPLELDYLNACLIIANSTFDALSLETQRALRAAGTKLQQRMELVGRDADRTVLSGSLIGQGVRATPVPPALRDAFYSAARDTRSRATGEVPPAALKFIEHRLATPPH